MPIPRVEALDWDDCMAWFRPRWDPGDHVAIVAPTGQGKTNVVVHIGNGRKFVAAIDPKGGDPTLADSGWARLPDWPPPPAAYRRMAEGVPHRYRIGPRIRTAADLPRLQAVCAKALEGVFNDGGWTVIVDELQIVADPRMMNLRGDVERLLIAARSQRTSVVSLYQAPRYVPRAAADQARWVWVALTYDVDVVNRLAEVLGRDKAEIRGAINALGSRPYTWLVASRDPRDPLVVTIPHLVRRPPRAPSNEGPNTRLALPRRWWS